MELWARILALRNFTKMRAPDIKINAVKWNRSRKKRSKLHFQARSGSKLSVSLNRPVTILPCPARFPAAGPMRTALPQRRGGGRKSPAISVRSGYNRAIFNRQLL
jgi:hypothetical protein